MLKTSSTKLAEDKKGAVRINCGKEKHSNKNIVTKLNQLAKMRLVAVKLMVIRLEAMKLRKIEKYLSLKKR